MKRGKIYGMWIVWMLGWFVGSACQSSDFPLSDVSSVEATQQVEFQVFSQPSVVSGNASAHPSDEEQNIQRLYIYAFDDVHTRPDFFQDFFTNRVPGGAKSYKVKMSINGLGKKRFYLLANPPEYIQKKLTYDCTEEELKTMTIALQHPLEDIKNFPQAGDGISKPGNLGFPMANQFTAFVNKGNLKDELLLTTGPSPAGSLITRIPIFRSLGKVTVSIRKKDPMHDGVFVKALRIYNYTCNGYFFPFWEGGMNADNWIAGQGIWNAALNLDLAAMSTFETRVGVDPVSLIQHDVWVESDKPVQLSSFYLCQNSYGKAMTTDMQQGMDDLMGNRTTKLGVELSDGRKSVVDFPYLRRNDHLQVNIVIAKNIIQVDFLPWVLDEVTPEWEDGLNPSTFSMN